ncbi:MAG: DUF3971 domain-containing protein [Pseudolabrys sp.]|nr:DUF3971 domain-containing protein [Pseudolabrys sp.]
MQELRRPFLRRLFWGLTVTTVVLSVGLVALWYRLSNGPIELDIATPWLKAAIEENFGATDKVTVGGTQIERDETGRTTLRLRDIVVRDAGGTVVASAPKAEVGLSTFSLLTGKVRAQSINLVGAEMAVRIETDGQVTVFAGADNRPIATTPPSLAPAVSPPTAQPVPGAAPPVAFTDLAGAMTWLEGIGATGLEGHDLRELGLKGGNLSVDDRRNGKQWKFDNINASLTRPHQGGVVFRLESVNPERPWVLSAAMRPLGDGIRAVGIEARKVSTRDMLLALRLNEDSIDVNLPVSASIRAEIRADGTPQIVQGQLYTDPGSIVDHTVENSRIEIERAEFRFDWDAQRRNLIVPFQIQSAGNQFTMRALVEPPVEGETAWRLAMERGDPVIDPVILGAVPAQDQEAFAINRMIVRAKIDPARKRLDLVQGDFSRVDTRPAYNIGVALTGSLDFAGAEPHLAFGVAGTRMPMSVLKRLWPVFAAADVRAWVIGHITGGTVERVTIAGNAPLPTFKNDGPPTPEDGLSIDIETSGTTVKPMDDLPPIRDADLNVHVTGSSATINLGRGTVEVAPGRKLNIASGVFEVPDTHLKPPPARVSFRIDGTVPVAAELLQSGSLRDTVGLPIDPSSSRGTISAQVTVGLPLDNNMSKNATTYAVAAELTNFSADKLFLGQKVESALMKVNAATDGYQIKGDVKLNGLPASIEVRRKKGEASAELRVAASVDEAARKRLGIDFGGGVTGSIPIRLAGLIGDYVKDDRMNVEADLTPVKIDNLLPGWIKPAGKAAKATFTLAKNTKQTRFDDLTVEGGGATVKGSVELDASNTLVAATFPVFSMSDGDKVSLKADRSGEGVLRVTMRGDVYDGRTFVKSALGGVDEKGKPKQIDLDLDIKIGTVAGHHGETLRGLDLRVSRRNGRIRTFSLNSKIGRDTPFNGDIRMRARDNHQVLFIETEDAGALFRFTDTYPKMFGGSMWVAMDPPTEEQAPQVGTITIRNFNIRGEAALDRIASGAGGPAGRGVTFSEASAGFTKLPGRMSVRDGIVRGAQIGATVEGQVDYAKDEVHLRGTFVPFYGLNNMFGLGQIPLVGMLLGGSNEGLVGITYEAVGPPGAPRISVNPVSAIAPGLLRKFIPSPGSFDPAFTPQR